ncbi:T9SS type A sorting domain-containing protein [Adhaeribacter rhizoryzae]|uniref:T9SS type A sorting domain-containing protein n=1 Tax=Adhaeribacter rhizoryzae TaxID=2607907 RepID=A0A5M6DPQ5_9BACT|nr:T9SS type A sorting domain-containing protein [Adhaeribacter rhizoryzae]KAA5548222.1 T9SS type A sorting domain-containing protein [Adhaeribacter rhizoryzae]
MQVAIFSIELNFNVHFLKRKIMKKIINFIRIAQPKEIRGSHPLQRSFWLLVMLVLLAHVTVQGQHPYGFLDGNVLNNDGKLDWQNVFTGTGLPANSISTGLVRDDATGELIYTGGNTKDHIDIPSWQYKSGESSPKTNILEAGAIAIGGRIYFFGNRFAAEGSTNIGFWFLQGQVAPVAGKFTGQHVVGDILVVAEIANGGAVGNIAAYKWVGPNQGDVPSSGKTLQTLATVANTNLAAVVNANDETTPWPHQSKGVAANIMPAITFFEGFVDLGGLGQTNACFSSFIVETRASFSVTSVLEDFTANEFNVRPRVTVTPSSACGSASLTATVQGGLGPFTYVWSGPGIVSGQGTPTIIVNATGTYSVVVSGQSVGGGTCSNSGSSPAVFNPTPGKPQVNYIPPACDRNTFSIEVVPIGTSPIVAGNKYVVLDKNGASIGGISPATTALNPYTATAADVSAAKITFSNIPAGSGFQVHVVNSFGCPSSPFTCPVATATSIRAVQSVKAPENSEAINKTEMAAYPIPFTNETTIEFKSINGEDYVINLYDLSGNLIKQLKSGKAKAGEITQVRVDGKGMAESIYLVRKVSKSGVSTVKLLKSR